MHYFPDIPTDILSTLNKWKRITTECQESAEQSPVGILPNDRKILDKLFTYRRTLTTLGTGKLTEIHSDNYHPDRIIK